MIRQKLHHLFCLQSNRNLDWFREQLKKNPIPFSSSYDIRDSGFKISNVDANIFPAGFNNICPKDHRYSSTLAKEFLQGKYGSGLQRIALVTEEHTQNPFYWDNVLAIRGILQTAGFKVLVGFPRRGSESWTLDSSSGEKVEVVSLSPAHAAFREFQAQLVISNNDFSLPLTEWAADIEVPIEPGRHLGWHQRRKSRYFFHYNTLVHEFCQVAGIDEFLLNVETEAFPGFDLNDELRMQSLAQKVDDLLARLQKKYSDRGIQDKPVAFVKNDAGTYGLAVLRVESGRELLDINSKTRKKMKAAKGGRDVSDVIVQEGIPTRISDEGSTAEPVIYMIGSELAGGFLRVHSAKGSTESLNSPGAVFKKLCVSDLIVQMDGLPLENVYGWSARLGVLAIGREAHEMQRFASADGKSSANLR